jgi:hypothetical protein
MPRPKSVTPAVEKSVSIPLDICAKVDLLLMCPIEQKIPHGAWSRLLQSLLREFLEKQNV